MTRRWRWPILDLVKGMDVEDLWITWLLGGGIVSALSLHFSIRGHRGRGGHVMFDWRHPLLYITILWLAPFAIMFVRSVGPLARFVVGQLIPRRVTEPVDARPRPPDPPG